MIITDLYRLMGYIDNTFLSVLRIHVDLLSDVGSLLIHINP